MRRNLADTLTLFAILTVSAPCQATNPRGPNVILIMTDDQGWGDVGFHGNPQLKTPHIDALAKESVELTQFYVCPVCSPTRASLMTGRYNYRTGAIDTYLGRSTMVADEVTLAEMFAAAGYHTGIFGKWHLGDNFPSRPIDQGFAESLVHRGGGMVQPADPPGGSYFDPVLVHNGHDVKTRGYCSDVFTDAAIEFVEKHAQERFLAYLAYNCPHTPLQVPEQYFRRYQGMELNDATAKIYGMVANIDENIGRLMSRLKTLGLEDNTIVVFLTDNGPQQPRYNGKLNDLKGSVYDGGIHVPCLVRWPGHFAAGSKIAQVAAHIDVAPTLLAACGIERPAGVAFDGVSLLDLLEGRRATLDERLLFFQWHRGDRPERYRACAVRGPRYKLVQPAGRGDNDKFKQAWVLYDMLSDAGETKNVIDEHPDVADEMKTAYDRWFDDVGRTRGYPPPRIVAGTVHENPLTLSRQDWRGPKAGWRDESMGHWDVDFVAGVYNITIRTPRQAAVADARLRVGVIDVSQPLPLGAERVTFRSLTLPAGTARIEATIERSGAVAGAHYVELECQTPMAER